MRAPRASQVAAAADGKAFLRLTRILKIISVCLASVLLLSTALFAGAYVATEQMSFPIKIFNANSKDNKGIGISLCDSRDFLNPTSRLNAVVPESMTNISVLDLPYDIDGNEQSGPHNGNGFVAYTFYIKSTVDTPQKLTDRIAITRTSKNADAAIRVRVYRDGKEMTYAKLSASGMPEYGTTPFAGSDMVFESEMELAANQIIRYTLVIWLEGDDPECVNDIMGGFVGFSMEFEADAVDDESSAQKD